jgi:ribonuclease VapC
VAETVLDASALLALLNTEPGAAAVAAVVRGASVSAVNYCEVVGKLAEAGMPQDAIRAALDGLGLRIIPFDAQHAQEAGLLRPTTRSEGLSLGDRACLVLARTMGATAWTADAVWGRVSVGVTVRVIR